MKKLKITKMNGSGNDFIIIDNRSDLLKGVSFPELARTLCRRREAVGADGLILVAETLLSQTLGGASLTLMGAKPSCAEMVAAVLPVLLF